jgi:AbrB family looped-hinge helix DNA binding protein
MKEITTTITQRGQVTIPAEVRKLLGVKPRDKVAFTIEADRVHLAAASFTLESAYGSVKPSRRPEDFEELSRAAKEAKAIKTLRKMRRS